MGVTDGGNILWRSVSHLIRREGGGAGYHIVGGGGVLTYQTISSHLVERYPSCLGASPAVL